MGNEAEIDLGLTAAFLTNDAPNVVRPARAGSLFNPPYSLTTTTGGEYVLTGSFSGARAPTTGWPVVLVYHGGGESAQEILEYSGLSALSAVVISIQGQNALNGRSWMNAFPWLQDNPRDDVAFTEHVLEEVAAKLPIDRRRIYATGKSDGGGMSVFLAAHPELRSFSVAAIAPVAGAYFGRSQTIGRESYSLPSEATDYDDIILAARQVPVLAMHGTADQVMPYEGGAFTTGKALESYDQPGSFWGRANGFTNDVAYTAPIKSYWTTWARKVNGATNVKTQPFTKSTTQHATLYKFTRGGALPLQHLQVVGANHDWFGHANSGPGSTTAASLQLDASQVVANFFRIPLKNYTSPVATGTPKLPLVSRRPPYTTLEAHGNIKLLRHGDGLAFVDIGAGRRQEITVPWGVSATVSDNNEWEMLAAEKIGDTNQVLWRNNYDSFLHIWNLDANWNLQSTTGAYGFNTPAAWKLETSFQVDGNRDGSIGMPV